MEAKLTKPEPVVPPPSHVTITMTYDEAQALMDSMANFGEVVFTVFAAPTDHSLYEEQIRCYVKTQCKKVSGKLYYALRHVGMEAKYRE